MKSKLVLLSVLSFVSLNASASDVFKCDDGGILEIGARNNAGYAEASLTYGGDIVSSLAAISFANSTSSIGTMLDDGADDLGAMELNGDVAKLDFQSHVVTCQK